MTILKEMKMLRILATALLVCFSLHAFPQEVKRIYLANDDHTDYMWTANEATYDSAFVTMLDFYLEQIEATKNNPSDLQARFNCDGSIWMQAYERNKTKEQFEKLLNSIRSGHISVPMHAMINCYGGQPTEAVIRGMYYAGRMERKHNLRFRMAGAMENNTIPLGLSSIWAGSGAKYSWYGIGGYGSQMSLEYRADRRHQLYNYTGLDGSSVLMKWYIYHEGVTTPLGGYAELRTSLNSKDPVKDIGSVVNMLDAMCDTKTPGSKYPYNVSAGFGYGHDDLATYLSQPYIDVAKKWTTPNRKVRVAILEDFFEDIEKTYPKLPSETLTYGNEWDLYPASMNETTAKVRRASEKLRAAEALAAVASLSGNTFYDKLATARHKAWDTFAYFWEHDWTGDSKLAVKERPAWQNKIQANLTNYVDTLQQLSVTTLGSQLSSAKNKRFFVFNPLSWSRNDVADIAYEGPFPAKVIDLQTKKEVPSQQLEMNGKKYLRVLAENVPSVGYKVYEVRTGKPAKRAVAATVTGETVSNDFYTLRLSPSGAITSLVDKRSGRELVKVTEGKYLNDLGFGDVSKGEQVTVENAGPVSVTLKAVSDHPLRHTVRVTMYANSPRIEIENNLQANFGDVKTWTFSFGLDKPTTRYEELGAVLTAKTVSNGGHYAEQNARYDWQTFNHFANMSEGNFGITLSNIDCSFFKLGKSSVYKLDDTSSQLQALAGGQVDRKTEDGGLLGFFNQNGETNFLYQFAITSHAEKFDPVKSMKFSLEHQNPLVTGEATGGKSGSTATSFSLLSVSDPNVLLWSVKPSEEGIGQGLITRFWNMNATPATPALHFNRNIKSAWQTTHIETNEKQLSPASTTLPLDFKQHQLKTYRVLLDTK